MRRNFLGHPCSVYNGHIKFKVNVGIIDNNLYQVFNDIDIFCQAFMSGKCYWFIDFFFSQINEFYWKFLMLVLLLRGLLKGLVSLNVLLLKISISRRLFNVVKNSF